MNARTTRTTRIARPDLVGIGLLALLACAGLAWFWFGIAATDPRAGDPLVGRRLNAIYDPPETAVENAFVKGDGQLFAGQATDPLVRHPELVRGEPATQAYRYQRVGYAWLGWLASAGQRDNVAIALIALTVASSVLLVLTVLRWLAAGGDDPRWALLVVLAPGVLIDLTWVGPEALGTALATLGLWYWWQPGAAAPARRLLAGAACFATAALCRETLLLLPFVVMCTELRRRRLDRAAVLATSAAPWVLWVLFLRVRIGAWPVGAPDGGLSAIPFGGLVGAVGSWHRADALAAVVVLGLALSALVLGRRSPFAALVAANLGLAAVLGSAVWARFPDFGRVLLPLTVLSLLAVLPGTRRLHPEGPPPA